jgi:hypothetical protein
MVVMSMVTAPAVIRHRRRRDKRAGGQHARGHGERRRNPLHPAGHRPDRAHGSLLTSVLFHYIELTWAASCRAD